LSDFTYLYNLASGKKNIEGLQGLKDKQKSGKPSLLNSGQKEELKDML